MRQITKTKKIVLISFVIVILILIFSVGRISYIGILKGADTDNGIVPFVKDTVDLVILGKDIREYISYEDVKADLKTNGFEDILFPKEFSEKLDKYKFTKPIYTNNGIEEISCRIYLGELTYGFAASKSEIENKELTFVGLENAETITINNIDFYLFDFGNYVSVMFFHNGFSYDIGSSCPYDDMIKIIESIK